MTSPVAGWRVIGKQVKSVPGSSCQCHIPDSGTRTLPWAPRTSRDIGTLRKQVRQGRQELAAESQIVLAAAVGKQATVVNALKFWRQYVYQKAADVLVGRQRHDLGTL